MFSFNNTFTTVFTTMSHVPCPNYTPTHREREIHLHIENITHSIEREDSEVCFLLIILLLLFSQPCPMFHVLTIHLLIENITHSIEKCMDSELRFLLIILLLLFSQPCPMFHVLTIHLLIEREKYTYTLRISPIL